MLGRPTARSPAGTRQQVLEYLKEEGAGVGVPRLRDRFPAIARAELENLLQRYRAVISKRWHTSSRVLHWLKPGSVWAMDGAEPSLPGGSNVLDPIDGRYPYLFAVRDLASRCQLAWEPVAAQTAEQAIAVLKVLFELHGAPLVMKTDNGAAFRAESFRCFLAQAGVIILYSPPYWPGYNGAIEAAIGSLKTRTARIAESQGRVDLWSTADVVAALAEANDTPRRRLLAGRTPHELWRERTPITATERAVFELAVERHRYLVRSEQGIVDTGAADHWQNARLDRKAIERVLVEHDLLLFKGRRIPLTITPGKVTFFA